MARQVPLGREALFGLGEAEIVADQVHQVGGILAVVDGEGGIEPDALGVFAQQPRADGVEGAGPGKASVSASGALAQHLRR